MTDGGGIVTISYFGAEKVVPRYNVMGSQKQRSKPVFATWRPTWTKGIRVNAISADR